MSVMDMETFLGRVLPSKGVVCIVGIKDKEVRQVFESSVSKAVKIAQDFDKRLYNTYFACATFKTPSNRTQSNVLALKSAYIDLDCGENKPYETKVDALTALKAFCEETKTPRPDIFVDSGRGLHIYWLLRRPYTKEEWQPLIDIFKKRIADWGLEADPAVTADAARILRIPGTHNYKDNPANEVRVLS